MVENKAQVVQELERLINYQFTSSETCWEALQGKGANGFREGNKRLALLGDAVLKVKHLTDWYPTGQTTETGHNIASRSGMNRHLTKVGRQVGLDALIIPNPSQKGVVGNDLVATTVEAIIGAVYMDGGEESLGGVMKRLGVL